MDAVPDFGVDGWWGFALIGWCMGAAIVCVCLAMLAGYARAWYWANVESCIWFANDELAALENCIGRTGKVDGDETLKSAYRRIQRQRDKREERARIFKHF